MNDLQIGKTYSNLYNKTSVIYAASQKLGKLTYAYEKQGK